MPAPASSPEFQRPWEDPAKALLIDAYHDNTIDWKQLGTEPRVVAVVHKATIGATAHDPAYFRRHDEARKRGYLWGSYHWGVPGEPEKQADFYLHTDKPRADELIALDLEDVSSPTLMNADEALRFIRRIREKAGRYPVLYTNHASARLLTQKFANTELTHVPLWYARFKPTVSDFPAGLWPTYTLWQFSSELLAQIVIPGTKPDMDVSVFNGSVAELTQQWPLTKAAP